MSGGSSSLGRRHAAPIDASRSVSDATSLPFYPSLAAVPLPSDATVFLDPQLCLDLLGVRERFTFSRFMELSVSRLTRKPLRVLLTLHRLGWHLDH